MYEIRVISDFSAAHMLRHYKGKCENIHGHNWKVEISLASKRLDGQGMVMDFKDVKKKMAAVLDGLDHTNLNDIPYFKKVNPTSENIAKYIYDKLLTTNDRRLTTNSGRLKVTVWESDTACSTYYER